MYTDLVIVVIFLLCVIIFFRNFSSFVYGMVIIDIFFRIINFIQYKIDIKGLSDFVNKYCPSSVSGLIYKYIDSGTITDILMWIYVGIYIIFLIYITKYFVKRRK